MITWEQLTAKQLADLRKVANGENLSGFSAEHELPEDAELWNMGLVGYDTDNDRDIITDLGKRVLAQAPTGQPEAEGAGEAEAIEAALWAGAELMGNVSDGGYEDAVKAKAIFANYRSRAIAMQQEFNAVRLEYASELQFELETFDKIWSAVTGDKIGQWDYPAQVARHVEHMRDDNATLRVQLAASLEREAALRAALADLTGRGSIIDWAIEAATVWNNFVSTTDSDAPVNEELALTLNVLDSKVGDYQRKAASDGGEGG